MKTIIAGSRNIVELFCTCKTECKGYCTKNADAYNYFENVIKSCPWEITEIVSGMAKGADTIGEKYAYQNSIPVKKFKPKWGKYGKQAGPIRNGEMATYADACIVIWDGESRGSANMIEQAKAQGLALMTQVPIDSMIDEFWGSHRDFD
jgi:hypothetical protein